MLDKEITKDLVLEIINFFESHGYETYAIGGATRSMIVGDQIFDLDIVTSARPNQIINFCKVVEIYENFLTCKIEYNGVTVDVATFREEKWSNFYPKVIYTEDLKKDLLRRDFTINTILFNKNAQFIDYYGGREDLINKQLKMISDPNIKLQEDPTRILRGLILTLKYDLVIEKELYKSMLKYKELVLKLSKNKRTKEYKKLILLNTESELLELDFNQIKGDFEQWKKSNL